MGLKPRPFRSGSVNSFSVREIIISVLSPKFRFNILTCDEAIAYRIKTIQKKIPVITNINIVRIGIINLVGKILIVYILLRINKL
jgi:hypothetical protein